jgi:hypothetical protein
MNGLTRRFVRDGRYFVRRIRILTRRRIRIWIIIITSPPQWFIV